MDIIRDQSYVMNPRLIVLVLLFSCLMNENSKSLAEELNSNKALESGVVEANLLTESGSKSELKPSKTQRAAKTLVKKKTSRQSKNQEVLNQLYNNIWLNDSGVLNYDKKIN